ncbi:coiled-coil domain-containing protein 30 isoform X6 [Micropterus salmoides]|uniref:coiled-coil domain-containing protein 30 isoform X6 n=1 Tax=Micropterus salmoides TaxID=27706 RepID=UPI0018EE21DC|nr:coiled-coil domain-containing protein 30 isoform X6 [Micropterus salmoides]
MDQSEEALEQITAWFSEEGLAPDSPQDAQLCLLWCSLQHTRNRLSSMTWDLDTQRSQHLAEMAEVRKSLEQIRVFTQHKDVLAQEIQDENDQLKDQLRRLISLQDAQISEVAKMLYQQGLTELIHSSPSEQVAYLLVERASLLETSEVPDNLTGDGNTASPLGTVTQAPNTNAHQPYHKGAPCHGQTPWKRLFGLHKASQSKHTFIPAEARHLAGQASSVERKCSRLERDLEEGSRRLAMAHNEIRRLTDELESAHLTQRAYEPELEAAQQEVEQLRQEVEKLKKYEMVELRKAKELNDRLDFEIRALRSRVRSLDAEKSSLQQTVVSLQEKVKRLESAQQQLLTVQVQANQITELAERESEQLKSALQELQQQAEQQLLTVQVQANQANELAQSQAAELAQSRHTCRTLQEKFTAQTTCLVEKEQTVVSLKRKVEELESALQELQQRAEQANQADELDKFQATELIQNNEICRALQNKLRAQSRSLLEKESEIHSLKQQLEHSHNNLDDLIATICSKENNLQDQKPRKQKQADSQLLETEDEELQTQLQLLQNKENTLCKEKELTISITIENDNLLAERRRLLQQLNEEEHNKKDSHISASLSKCRVDFLETENKELRNKILHMSNRIAVPEQSLQNMQSLHFAEELKKISNPTHVFTSLLAQTSSVKMMPEPCEIQSLLDNTQSKQPEVTSSPHCCISGPLSQSAEIGYLNLTSAQNRSDHSAPPAALSSSDSTCC